MRRLLLSATFATLFVCFAQAQITIPQPSPAGSVTTQVGLTDVHIDYFRPKVKGRMIFGEGDSFLQPYGQLWRTGANAGSKISFSTDVEVAGTPVAAGEYLIFTVPGASEWHFMLYADLSLGGNVASYDETHEVLRTTVTPMQLSMPVETLTFNIADISEDNTTAHIEMAWADVSIKVPVKVDFDATVMAAIEANTRVDANNYIQAATYYHTTGRDLNQALEWVNLYFAEGTHSHEFWNIHLKAQILAKLGNAQEAIATAEESMTKAQANENGDFGYVKRNQDLIAEIRSN